MISESDCTLGPCKNANTCDPSKIKWPSEWSECSLACDNGWQFQTRAPTGPDDACPLVRSRTCNMGTCAGPAACKAPTPDEVTRHCIDVCLGAGSESADGTWQEGGVIFCGVQESARSSICGVPSGVCPTPQDCSLSAWSDWGRCSLPECDHDLPQGGLAARSRTIEQHSVGGGKSCASFDLVQSQPCNNLVSVAYGPLNFPPQCSPIDCELSDWVTASECTAACGGGQDMISRTIKQQPSGGGVPCPTDPSEYYNIIACNTQSCVKCEYETWDTYFAREGRSAVWSSCSGCDGVQEIGPRKVVKPASLGGFCDPKGAYVRRQCCQDCECAYCPVGCNGEMCSSRGKCVLTNTTLSDNAVATTGKCECDAGAEGANCGIECPLGPNGIVCSGPERGTCGVNGTCECVDGVSGPSCALGGSCIARVFNGPGGVGGESVCMPLDDNFNAD